MRPEVINQLLELNEKFYQTFALQFSQTRQHLQPGVNRLLPLLATRPSLLDLGCGNGELARRLAQLSYGGIYVGIDNSPGLLQAAQAGYAGSFRPYLVQASLAQADWEQKLPQARFASVLAFAVLHHLPGQELRRSLLHRVRSLLEPEGSFICSNWQFLRSPRLVGRIQDWATVGLDPTEVEFDDYLLDWRQGGPGVRFVHHFLPSELHSLADQTGFVVQESFLSDGKSGDLSLYQIWEAV